MAIQHSSFAHAACPGTELPLNKGALGQFQVFGQENYLNSSNFATKRELSIIKFWQ